jgi:hypothetical protein
MRSSSGCAATETSDARDQQDHLLTGRMKEAGQAQGSTKLSVTGQVYQAR